MSAKKINSPQKYSKIKKTSPLKKGFKQTGFIGLILILIALAIPLKTFSPVIKSEIKYRINPPKIDTDIIPVDQNFSLVIPKINANTRVIVNVDPFSSQIYQQALTQGVAHAKNTSTPDKNGNTFIFAHSAGNWYQANQFNAVFYLLNKLHDNQIDFLQEF